MSAMDAGALLFLQQKLRSFESSCSHQAHQVANARDLTGLVRLAQHAPHADPMIRFMPEVKRASYKLELAIMDTAMSMVDNELKRIEADVRSNPDLKFGMLNELMRKVRMFSGHNPMVVSRGLDKIQRHPVNRIKQAS